MKKLVIKIDVGGVLRDIYPAIICCYEKEKNLKPSIKSSDIEEYKLEKVFRGIGDVWEFLERNV